MILKHLKIIPSLMKMLIDDNQDPACMYSVNT